LARKRKPAPSARRRQHDNIYATEKEQGTAPSFPSNGQEHESDSRKIAGSLSHKQKNTTGNVVKRGPEPAPVPSNLLSDHTLATKDQKIEQKTALTATKKERISTRRIVKEEEPNPVPQNVLSNFSLAAEDRDSDRKTSSTLSRKGKKAVKKEQNPDALFLSDFVSNATEGVKDEVHDCKIVPTSARRRENGAVRKERDPVSPVSSHSPPLATGDSRGHRKLSSTSARRIKDGGVVAVESEPEPALLVSLDSLSNSVGETEGSPWKTSTSTQNGVVKEKIRPVLAGSLDLPDTMAYEVADQESISVKAEPQRIDIGTKVRKYFEGYGSFVGEVTSLVVCKCYRIKYEDGDEELLDTDELRAIVTKEKTNRVVKKHKWLRLGTSVEKQFGNDGWFSGEVIAHVSSCYKIRYDDGDEELLEHSDISDMC
jgi:hypothetical protein